MHQEVNFPANTADKRYSKTQLQPKHPCIPSNSAPFTMQPHRDLNAVLSPHLQALSTASATVLSPLTSVLATLVNELVALRAAHDRLQARVSRLDAHLPILPPHSIPSLPSSPPPNSVIVDPDLTQPPSPLPQETLNRNHSAPSASPHSQNDTPHHQTNQNQPSSVDPSANASAVNHERLKRRRRSSRRPSSGTPAPRIKQEMREYPVKSPSSQEEGRNIEKLGSANSSTGHPPSHGLANVDKRSDARKKMTEPTPKILQERDQKKLVLPTTPTTETKPKKRKVFSYEPIIEGYSNAAVAVKEVEKIVTRREAENCPPSLRPQQKPPSEGRCLQCQGTLRTLAAEAPNPEQTFQRLMQSRCRHKEKAPRPATPEGYWALDFAETPTQPP